MGFEFQAFALAMPQFSSEEPFSLKTRLAELGLRRGSQGTKAMDPKSWGPQELTQHALKSSYVLYM